MAVLAATAEVFRYMESGKFRKNKSEMEKIAKQALNFYKIKPYQEEEEGFQPDQI